MKKVLFVRSGNNRIDPISTRQGESLNDSDFEVHYYNVIGKGTIGYLKNILPLRKIIRERSIEIIHAHYSYCGIISFLSTLKKNVVCSLMGSDVIGAKRYQIILLRLVIKFIWKQTIVKSQEMKEILGIGKIFIIPNGVCLEEFSIDSNVDYKEKLNWDKSKVHILFGSDPNREEKNFTLALKALEILRNRKENLNIELHFLKNISMTEVADYYLASDLLLLTSLHEGSPNSIKEAMACNCPIVSTDVGDVRIIIDNTDGCYLTSFEPKDVANCINKAILFIKKHGRTCGRDQIIRLGLTSEKVSKKIKSVYSLIN